MPVFTTASPVEAFLAELKQVKGSGNGWIALCPSHDDHHASLSVGRGTDGRVLLNCFAGCRPEAIVQAVGWRMADLFQKRPSRLKRRRSNGPSPIRVADLALNKQLPLDFLRELGLRDTEKGVVIPYHLQNGLPASRDRLRVALSAPVGSRWLPGEGSPVPYGLDRLVEASEAGYLCLVEGESDTWTLWHHSFPCLGIPGSTMTGLLRREHLKNIQKIYVLREPGQSGDTFAPGVAKRLHKLYWKGELSVVRLRGAKDPNELHAQDPKGFPQTFQAALKAARPWTQAENWPESIDPLTRHALFDLRDLFQSRKAERLPSALICRELAERPDGRWAHLMEADKPVCHRLASLLRPVDVRPKQLRFMGAKTRGFFFKVIAAALERYSPEDPVQTPPFKNLQKPSGAVRQIARTGTHAAKVNVATAPELFIPSQCFWCRNTKFWIHVWGGFSCVRCHPPAAPMLVKKWVDKGPAAGGLRDSRP